LDAHKVQVPVIVGPTAVGKTAVVEALADTWSLAVVSADSRQIYRHLNVGTAKPDPAARARVPHYGLDLVDPGVFYSAGQFARDAARWLQEVQVSGRRPVVVGGTGFYVRALADGLFHEPPMPAQARQHFRRWAAQRTGTMAGWAARLDPAFSGGGHQRATRTVEVALLTGRSLSWWQRHAAAHALMRPWYVRLTAPRAFLHKRIADRVRDMMARGWIEEVRALLERGMPRDAPGLDGVGYREIVAHLRGDLERDRLEEAIIVSTRRYAKRQETWFRHQLQDAPVHTLDATESAGAIADRIAVLWDEAEV
jgi:tRNA dimethylallyltransferase